MLILKTELIIKSLSVYIYKCITRPFPALLNRQWGLLLSQPLGATQFPAALFDPLTILDGDALTSGAFPPPHLC